MKQNQRDRNKFGQKNTPYDSECIQGLKKIIEAPLDEEGAGRYFVVPSPIRRDQALVHECWRANVKEMVCPPNATYWQWIK